jgi:hypothetical protein
MCDEMPTTRGQDWFIPYFVFRACRGGVPAHARWSLNRRSQNRARTAFVSKANEGPGAHTVQLLAVMGITIALVAYRFPTLVEVGSANRASG